MAISAFRVYFFIPNLIGYLRVIFCAISYCYAFSDPKISIICYFIGAGLDAVDGIAARYFGQCSKFGAVLDMLTDRMGTSVLLVVLSHMYPSIWGIFAGLLVLDIVSHWYQMYATLVQGKTTHKGSDSSALLNFYYTFPYALLVCCCGNEFFIMSLYLMPHYPSAWLTNFAIINFPIFVFKQFMNVVQLWDSTQKLTAMDALEHNAKLAKKDQDVVAFTSSSPSGHGHSHGHGHSCGGHGHSH